MGVVQSQKGKEGSEKGKVGSRKEIPPRTRSESPALVLRRADFPPWQKGAPTKGRHRSQLPYQTYLPVHIPGFRNFPAAE